MQTSKYRIDSYRRRSDIKDEINQNYIPADNYVESDVCFRGKITLVSVKIRWNANYVPCTAFPIIRQINEVLIVVECERDLIAIEGPRAEFHDACLLIEGEIRNIDCARALIDRWRHPEHLSVRIY